MCCRQGRDYVLVSCSAPLAPPCLSTIVRPLRTYECNLTVAFVGQIHSGYFRRFRGFDCDYGCFCFRRRHDAHDLGFFADVVACVSGSDQFSRWFRWCSSGVALPSARRPCARLGCPACLGDWLRGSDVGAGAWRVPFSTRSDCDWDRRVGDCSILPLAEAPVTK